MGGSGTLAWRQCEYGLSDKNQKGEANAVA